MLLIDISLVLKILIFKFNILFNITKLNSQACCKFVFFWVGIFLLPTGVNTHLNMYQGPVTIVFIILKHP